SAQRAYGAAFHIVISCNGTTVAFPITELVGSNFQGRHAMGLNKFTGGSLSVLGVGAALALMLSASADAQTAASGDPVRVGIVSFLTGPAAVPFGVPGRNAAELIIDAINEGTLPAPYNEAGLGGAPIEARYIDEAGSTANQVTEYR